MILFLYGEDTYRSREKLRQIEDKFKKTDKSRVNLVTVDGEGNPWRSIEKEILAAPFLHNKKLVIVENFLKKKAAKQDEFTAFLRNNSVPEGTVVVFWEDGAPDERTAAFKLLNKPKVREKFDPLSPQKLSQWLLREVKNKGGKIEEGAVEILVNLVGPDLWQMKNEIDKLVAYRNGQIRNDKSSEEIITAEDVNLLVRGKFDENIFKLTDALGMKNKKMIFKILREQIQAGLKESYIFSMLVRQVRILLQIKETVENNYSFVSLGDPLIRQKIASELGLHPYAVSKTLYQIKNYSLKNLKEIYGRLLAVDMKMKKTNLNHGLLLDLLIAEVCL